MNHQYIKTMLVFVALLITMQGSLAAENSDDWWGAEIEGNLQQAHLSKKREIVTLRIEGITGLGGTVNAPVVSITCPETVVDSVVSQSFLKIFATRLIINDAVYKASPFTSRTTRKPRFILNNTNLLLEETQERPSSIISKAFECELIPEKNLMLTLQELIEQVIKQGVANLTLETTSNAGSDIYSWKLPYSLNILFNGRMFNISTIACPKEKFIPSHYDEQKKHHSDSWELEQTQSIQQFKECFSEFIDYFNDVHTEQGYYIHDFKQNTSIGLQSVLCMGKDKCIPDQFRELEKYFKGSCLSDRGTEIIHKIVLVMDPLSNLKNQQDALCFKFCSIENIKGYRSNWGTNPGIKGSSRLVLYTEHSKYKKR